jgi:hypothetical protein
MRYVDSLSLLLLQQSYVDKQHILSKPPVESLDVQAVGSLVHLAVNKGRQARPQSQVRKGFRLITGS